MIVDQRLKAGSGVAAVTAIARVATIPHIFMSGERLPDAIGSAIFLKKPFVVSDLVSAIDRTSGTGRPRLV
jgi:hypothetical protein